MTTGVSFKAVKKPTSNEAVQFCLDMWKEAYDLEFAKKNSEYNAAQAAHKAYREAMPDLISISDVRDFIACVGRGILIKAFDESEASRLLAAARIASQSFVAVEKAILRSVARSQAAA